MPRSFLQLAAQHIAAPAGGCFHLLLRSTEMAEPSSPIKSTNVHRGDGKRFVVRADERLTASLELESAARVRWCPT